MAFYIHSKTTGLLLGIYEGADAKAAAENMRKDAGYQDDTAAAAALGVEVGDLNDDLRIEEVSADEPEGMTSGWIW